MKTSTKGITGMKKYLALFIAGALLLLSACDTLLTDAKDEVAGKLPDVFVAGGYSQQGDPYGPCIWKNGERIILERHPSIGTYYYYVNAIYIEGDDIYAAGSENNGGNWAICYWKNSKKFIFGSYDGSQGYSICVSGNDVYIAGTAGGNFAFWHNGLRNTIPNYLYGPNGNTTSVIYRNGILYVTGIEQGNGVLYRITSSGVYPTSLYDAESGYYLMPNNNTTMVVDGKVYIGGYTSSGTYPAYWYDGKVIILDPTYAGNVYGASYRNGTSYWAGQGFDDFNAYNYACYWKNNSTTKHWLTPFDWADYNNTFANSIYVTEDGDVLWSGFLAQSTNWGFRYNDDFHVLRNDGNPLPHMLVRE